MLTTQLELLLSILEQEYTVNFEKLTKHSPPVIVFESDEQRVMIHEDDLPTIANSKKIAEILGRDYAQLFYISDNGDSYHHMINRKKLELAFYEAAQHALDQHQEALEAGWTLVD